MRILVHFDGETKEYSLDEKCKVDLGQSNLPRRTATVPQASEPPAVPMPKLPSPNVSAFAADCTIDSMVDNPLLQSALDSWDEETFFDADH